MLAIYLWSIDQSRRQAARMSSLSDNAVGRVFRHTFTVPCLPSRLQAIWRQKP